ncbi:MAG: CotH kinase family protein [Candidatus Omnitrophica bacterium]|nr:CotH kinase family protein [Candidatus Omnitrophota bacterium]
MGGPGGGRGPGGPGGGGVNLDPLVAANDANKPLLSKLLAVPSLRTRYVGYMRDIAGKWLDWNRLGPSARQYQALIAGEVKADTRKLHSTEAFLSSLEDNAAAVANSGGRQTSSLKAFAEKRRAFLLDHAEVKKAGQ